jgi:large subunit ribosomal protein L18
LMNKKQSRLRRGRQTRAKIAVLKATRLSVHRTNLHIYANVIGPDAKILASSSTLEADIRQQLDGKNGGNVAAATLVGKRVAEKALQKLLSIVPVFVITAVSKHWLKLLAKQV